MEAFNRPFPFYPCKNLLILFHLTKSFLPCPISMKNLSVCTQRSVSHTVINIDAYLTVNLKDFIGGGGGL